MVKRATRLAVWRACSRNDGSASKWCWKMRRAVIIFRINRGGKAGWQTSRAIMHLIMAGSSTSAPHRIMLFSQENGARGWFWTRRALGFDRSGGSFCPQCCHNFKLERSSQLTFLTNVCGPVCMLEIPETLWESAKTKSVCFSIGVYPEFYMRRTASKMDGES